MNRKSNLTVISDATVLGAVGGCEDIGVCCTDVCTMTVVDRPCITYDSSLVLLQTLVCLGSIPTYNCTPTHRTGSKAMCQPLALLPSEKILIRSPTACLVAGHRRETWLHQRSTRPSAALCLMSRHLISVQGIDNLNEGEERWWGGTAGCYFISSSAYVCWETWYRGLSHACDLLVNDAEGRGRRGHRWQDHGWFSHVAAPACVDDMVMTW